MQLAQRGRTWEGESALQLVTVKAQLAQRSPHAADTLHVRAATKEPRRAFRPRVDALRGAARHIQQGTPLRGAGQRSASGQVGKPMGLPPITCRSNAIGSCVRHQPLIRWLAVAVAVAVAVGCALAAGSARADLPAPNQYNMTPSEPSCSVQTVGAGNMYCGPWNVPFDPNGVYGDDPSAYGFCEYWAAEKRPDAARASLEYGTPDPSLNGAVAAADWAATAEKAGYPVDNQPEVGDVVVYPRGVDSPGGHVAYVEQVNSDGSFVISEMNVYPRQGDIAFVPAGVAQDLYFIHQLPPGSGSSGGPGGSGEPPGSGSSGGHGGSGAYSSMHARISRIHRSGWRVTLTVRFAENSGKAVVVAQHGRRVVHVRASEASPISVRFAGTLSPGRWKITVKFTPARGYTVAKATQLFWLTIPRGAQ
jgi:surface antigen